MHSSIIQPRGPASARVIALVAVVALAGAATSAPQAAAIADAATPGGIELEGRGWMWPVDDFRLDRAYEAPAHQYGAGHRGIDLRPVDGLTVTAPAAGVVAFAGAVAGRGILTIDHGDGLVTTLEPIDTALAAGEPLARGDEVGTIALGGHSAPGALHFGVRLHGEYLNPLLLLGGVPRAVLLPCC